MNKKVFIISMITLIIDQISKLLATIFLDLNTPKMIINNFFYLNLCHNTGIAWSLLNNKRILIIILTIIALIIIIRYIKSFKNNIRNTISFGLLIGGLLGNLIDRTFYGYVIDFLDFYIFKYDYPVFNLADIFIVISILLLIISIIKGDDEDDSKSK